MQSKHKIQNTDWWICMDIPLAIPRSKELLPNLFLQERSLDKSRKKVGGLWREVKWMGRKKSKQTKTHMVAFLQQEEKHYCFSWI